MMGVVAGVGVVMRVPSMRRRWMACGEARGNELLKRGDCPSRRRGHNVAWLRCRGRRVINSEHMTVFGTL
jgi:hypothetical protein